MNKDEPLRITVVGQGLIGRQRAAAAQSIEGATLAATVDPNVPGDGSAPHYKDLNDVPLESYDAAVVAVPHDVAATRPRGTQCVEVEHHASDSS